tara:strand:+ start:884 stop:1117 length:234 start_codon:yes stop_codon:yes gene_type:complete
MQHYAVKLAAKNDFLSLYPTFKCDTTALLSECDEVLRSIPVDKQNVEIAKVMLKYELFTEADCFEDDDGTTDENVSH